MKKFLFTFTAYTHEIAENEEEATQKAWDQLVVDATNGDLWDLFIVDVEEDETYTADPEDEENR